MDAILADYTVSISEFKKNPAQVLREAGETPVAVLSHNRPTFYMVAPAVFEAMLEELADRDLATLVRERLARRESAVEVDIDSV
jgi:antitoxin StbD